ncbi:uncharacterized protein [Cardiocondyla obscurior]|uniref:uncharacterized protein n=1 Tax=Cardiocondyla obscurior TaxID=286306 RepID=UPI0039657377
MLIGAELFWQMLCVGQVRATHEHSTLQRTRMGWVLAGRLGDARESPGVCALHASVNNAELHDSLSKFWELEEVTETRCELATEVECEKHFMNTVETDESGRYTVQLPVRAGALASLGSSRDIAIRRFCNLEKRMARDGQFRQAYVRFMTEYANLGHMRIIKSREIDKPGAVYLPHHGVCKGGNAGAKLRVVFDASCKTSKGNSLNDAFLKGPTIQQELTSILIRFRLWRYVFSADVVKMYRQIRVHASQTHLQRIVWRESPNDPLQTYELLTVTYGTTSAPFLATRCLQHLAERHVGEWPVGSKHMLRDFYVDDLLTGANTLIEATRVRDQIGEILKRGRLELSKWMANHEALLPRDGLPGDGISSLADNGECRILGIRWDPVTDEFAIEPTDEAQGGRVTKRAVLAEIARLFDPLGILGPLIVQAKLILQETWQTKIEWDETLPPDLHRRWTEFRERLPQLKGMRVPRWVGAASAREVQLHGFCDASERAYGACLYVRTSTADGQHRITLLTAKSRVAPVRAVSLPQLELSAALLLAKLVEKTREALEFKKERIVL